MQTENPQLDLVLRTQELYKYAREVKAGFVVTPSVRQHIERVKEAWKNGQMVLLTGPTGTGKTEILVEVAKEMDNDFPELIAGTDQTGLAEIFGSVGLEEGEKGGTKTKHEPGPFTRALQNGKKLVFDEINLVSNKINMALKAAANRQSGEPVDIPRNGKVMRADGYAMGATMNVKSEKHKDRFELDPAVARIFHEQIKIPYLPPEEMYDVCFSTFLDSSESAPAISQEDAVGLLKNFVSAVVDTQRAYEGESEFIEAGKAAQNKKSSLAMAVIDIGSALSMLKTVDFSKPDAKLKLGVQLARFASRENYPLKDRVLLAKIFTKWKLLDGVSWSELEVAGIIKADLTSLGWKENESIQPEKEWRPITALEIATLDPFGVRQRRKAKEDEGEFGTKAGDGTKVDKTTEISFEYNESEARRLGLIKLELEGKPQADILITQYIDDTKSILAELDTTKDEDRKKELQKHLKTKQVIFVDGWQKSCPDVPIPCVLAKNDWWYMNQLARDKMVSSLINNSKTVRPNFSDAEIILADSWQEEDYEEKVAGTEDKIMQTVVSLLLQEFFGSDFKGVVKIKREDLDGALWEGDPADRVPTEKHLAVLAKLDLNPTEFEFRCIRQDEYARASVAQNWGQKNLWTNFDNFFLGGDVGRRGLAGGGRGYGGPSDVDDFWRADASGDLAVRLVLSRKQK